MSPQQAVGVIETRGFPGVLAAADAMVKAGRVTLVGYLRCGSARFCVIVRGDVSEVKTSIESGLAAVEVTSGAVLEGWVIIPRPDENVVAVLPIDFSSSVEVYRAATEGIRLPGPSGR
jgi:microcompartment protein CcmL/EutN